MRSRFGINVCLRRDEVVDQNSGNLHRFTHQERRGEARLQCSIHSRCLQQGMSGDSSRRHHVTVFIDSNLNANGARHTRGPSFCGINRLRQTDRLAVQHAAGNWSSALARGSSRVVWPRLPSLISGASVVPSFPARGFSLFVLRSYRWRFSGLAVLGVFRATVAAGHSCLSGS